MRTKLVLMSFLTFCLMATNVFAQNRWGIMGGVNFNTSVSSTESFKWSPGGYIGGLYDIQLTKSWYIQPQLLFSYEENDPKGMQLNAFNSQYALTLPVLVSFKVEMSKALALRISAGPYVQYALFGRNKELYADASGKNPYTKLGWWHHDLGEHFTYGLKGGLALEGKHFFTFVDCKYSLKSSPLNYGGHGLTLSAGIGYKF